MAMTKQERARADLAKKIELENQFKLELIDLYNSIFADYRRTIKRTGGVPDAAIYQPRFKRAIEKQYKRVFDAFASSARSQKIVQLKEDESEEQITEEVIAIMLLISSGQAVSQANEITQTNQRYFLGSYNKAVSTLLKEEGSYTNESLALAATAILSKRNGGRVGSTALTETQWAAESAKFTEAEVTGGLPSSLLVVAQGGTPLRQATGKKKDWSTVTDGRQRPAHNEANKQTQPIEQPFNVGGERLMYPADRSLGASKANVIGCRCSAIY